MSSSMLWIGRKAARLSYPVGEELERALRGHGWSICRTAPAAVLRGLTSAFRRSLPRI
jgi:hypothetical protein